MNLEIKLKRTYMKIYSCFHPMKRSILFSSFYGKQYSDNPKAICEKMHQKYPEFELWFLLSDDALKNADLPTYVKPVRKKTLALYKAICKSFCFVTNCLPGDSIVKRKGQLFIQTWHGDIAIKKILCDEKPERDLRYQNSITDYCVAGSRFGEEVVYRKAFRYNGSIISKGMPRNDLLISRDEDRKRKIRQKLGIPDSTFILLYAPTFREKHLQQEVDVELNKVINILEEKGDKWICLIRRHTVSKGITFECDGKRFIDVTSIPDMADLLAITNMLLTDYSSSAGDFVLTKKPVILVQFDLDEYTSKERNLYFNPKEAGFVVARNQSELEKILRTYSEKEYVESCNKVIEYFGIYENCTSSDCICDIIQREYLRMNGMAPTIPSL